jgi:hypothetical protein
MKKNIILFGLLALTSTFTITSCADDDSFGVEQSQNSILTLSFSGDNIKEYKNLTVEIREVNTGIIVTKVIENSNAYSLELPKGSYKILVNGQVVTREDETLEAAGNAVKDIVTNVENLSIKLYPKQFSNDFIIEEVFYSGNPTPEGKAYNSGRYFKLVNNTENTIYADKLIIAVSDLTAHSTNVFSPYNNNEYLPVRAVMVLPGSGTEYPVSPGDFIVVADNAINHSTINPNAYNLSNADFEYPNTNPSLGNVDQANVPNANVIFTTYNYNMFYLFNYSADGFAIARFPEGESSETFIANYKYDYQQTTSTGTTSTKSTYKIPNSWIIDGVNNGYADKLIQLVLGSSIDAGYSTVGTSSSNTDRYGKSIRRVVIGQSADGKNVYKDTNNSSNDFIKSAEPSLKNGIVH